jgi:hypothetical protein
MPVVTAATQRTEATRAAGLADGLGYFVMFASFAFLGLALWACWNVWNWTPSADLAGTTLTLPAYPLRQVAEVLAVLSGVLWLFLFTAGAMLRVQGMMLLALKRAEFRQLGGDS